MLFLTVLLLDLMRMLLNKILNYPETLRTLIKEMQGNKHLIEAFSQLQMQDLRRCRVEAILP